MMQISPVREQQKKASPPLTFDPRVASPAPLAAPKSQLAPPTSLLAPLTSSPALEGGVTLVLWPSCSTSMSTSIPARAHTLMTSLPVYIVNVAHGQVARCHHCSPSGLNMAATPSPMFFRKSTLAWLEPRGQRSKVTENNYQGTDREDFIS